MRRYRHLVEVVFGAPDDVAAVSIADDFEIAILEAIGDDADAGASCSIEAATLKNESDGYTVDFSDHE